MIRTLYDRLASLNLGLWLMLGVLLLLGVGSFVGGGEGSSLNDLPLFAWLSQAPFAESWWLWATVALLAALALNTVLCSIESLRSKFRQERFLFLVAPQVMHLGFLLIVLAHLFSAVGGFKQAMEIVEGSSIGFPDGTRVRVERLEAQLGPRGMPTDYHALLHSSADNGAQVHRVSPNHPFFHGGFGLYLKHLQPVPFPIALVEVHREPGAGLALAGALLFTAGNVLLLAVRRGR